MTCVIAILDIDSPQNSEGSTIITQEVLQQYQTFCVYEAKRKELREKIIKALSAGANVEAGPLTAVRQLQLRRILSLGKVEAVLGAEDAARLLSDVEPTECEHLHVGKSRNNPRRQAG